MYRLEAAVNAEPVTHPEDYERMNNVFPMLQRMHEEEKITRGILPEDADIYPSTHVSITPFYMGAGSEPEIGVWRMSVDGVIDARVASGISNAGMFYNFTVGEKDGGHRLATAEEVHSLIDLLSYIHSLPTPQKNTEQQERLCSRIGKSLLSVVRHIRA